MPLSGAPQLAKFGEFELFVRNPRMPSDEEVKAPHDDIVNVIVKPAGKN